MSSFLWQISSANLSKLIAAEVVTFGFNTVANDLAGHNMINGEIRQY